MKQRPERVVQMLGKTVPMDYFLFSCLERERMTKHGGPLESGLASWPAVASPSDAAADETSKLSSEIGARDLPTQLAELNQWYLSRHPELGQKRQLTYEILSEIVAPFVLFTKDLAALVLQKTGKQIPAHNVNEAAGNEFWSMLRASLEKNYPEYAPFFERFLEWAYAHEVQEKWELGSRPPVGRFAPSMRMRGIAPRGGDRGPKPSGGGGGAGRDSRPPREDKRPPREDSRPPREDNRPARENRPARASGGDDRPPRADRGPRGGRGDGGRNGPPSRSPEKSQELESAAMADVAEAIEKLKKTPEMSEICLKPANSYYRRLQHQHAVDLGFNTNSVGEGSERTVKISRE